MERVNYLLICFMVLYNSITEHDTKYEQDGKLEADVYFAQTEPQQNIFIVLFYCVCSEGASSALRASQAFTAFDCFFF